MNRLFDDVQALLARAEAAEARLAEAERERGFILNAVSCFGVRFLDPPDGGDVLLSEQITRICEALIAAEARLAEAERRTSKAEALTTMSITVGGGLVVYGDADAIGRVQNYILLDSTHSVEKEDVRRSLMRQLQTAEARIAELETALIWCSASPSFAPKGEAREGWLKLCKPLIDTLHSK